MTKEEVRARIAELAIVPAVRAANAEDPFAGLDRRTGAQLRSYSKYLRQSN